MATEGGDVKFRFGADSGPVLNALQDIQNAGAKAGDRVALSVGRGSTALGAMAKAGAGAGGSMGKLGAAMGPLGGILARISPEAGAAAASIAGLTSASSTAAVGLGVSAGVMGVALGAVAAAALPFIGALVVMQREATEAAARTDFLAAHLHDLDAAHRALAASTLAAAVANGTKIDITTAGTAGTVTPTENINAVATDLSGVQFLAAFTDERLDVSDAAWSEAPTEALQAILDYAYPDGLHRGDFVTARWRLQFLAELGFGRLVRRHQIGQDHEVDQLRRAINGRS